VFKRGRASKYAYGVFKRGFAPLLISPPPLIREGDKGEGLPIKNG